jgi:hypothetical protein
MMNSPYYFGSPVLIDPVFEALILDCANIPINSILKHEFYNSILDKFRKISRIQD